MPQTHCTILINSYVPSVTHTLRHGSYNRMYQGVEFYVCIREKKEHVSQWLQSDVRSGENVSLSLAGVPGASNSQHHRLAIKKHH